MSAELPAAVQAEVDYWRQVITHSEAQKRRAVAAIQRLSKEWDCAISLEEAEIEGK